MNEQPQPPETPQLEDKPPLDIDKLTAQERVSYTLDIRHRVNEGKTVSDDEIRDAVRCIRLIRADSAGKRGVKKATAAPVTLADF